MVLLVLLLLTQLPPRLVVLQRRPPCMRHMVVTAVQATGPSSASTAPVAAGRRRLTKKDAKAGGGGFLTFLGPLVAALSPAKRSGSFKFRDDVNESVYQELKSLKNLTQDEVVKLMKKIKLGKYASQFSDNHIDGRVLSNVDTIEDLEVLNIRLPTNLANKFLRDLDTFKKNGVLQDDIM